MIVQDMSNDWIYSEAKEIADERYKTLEEQTSEARKVFIRDEYKRIKHDAIIDQIEAEKKAKEYIEINKLDT
jgi:hypothetical protein